MCARAPAVFLCEVRGLVSDIVTKAGDLTQKYKGQCFVVTAVRDNRRGSPSMHHWRLEGK